MRVATVHDANAAVAVLIASITELCAVDHLNDSATLDRWLQSKTVSHFERWLADPTNHTVVAELDSTLCGVAILHESGTIRLCYVAPGNERCGVGRALIEQLETEATRRGQRQLSLMSSGNARTFYERLEYTPDGDPTIAFGVLRQYPYSKSL